MHQYLSFKANCTMRDWLPCVLTTPNCGFPRLTLGGSKCGVLVRLKQSARSCTSNFSPRRVVLLNAISICFVASARLPDKVRPALPNVYAGGFVNCAVSNQRSVVG